MTEHFVPRSAVHSYGTRFIENGCFFLPKSKGFGKKKHLHSGVVNYGTIYQPISKVLLVNRVLKLL